MKAARGGTEGAPAPARDEKARRLAPYDEQLRLPELRPGFVARPHLVARITDPSTPPVVLLSAPGGYGKTTLIAEWAPAAIRRVAYVSLTERENDAAVLIAYVARALDAVAPLDERELAVLSAPGADLTTVLLPALGTSLRRRPDVVLVLDDVHLLHSPDALRVVEVLVENVADDGRLILAARRDPALPVGRLRAQRRLLRLGTDDLRLDADTADALLVAAGVELDRDTRQALLRRTEGWPAGLYLAALSARTEPGTAALRQHVDDGLSLDFLREEYLAVLPPPLVDFLVRTSVLDRLCGPLCDAVLERADSAQVITELERSNLFLIPVDRAAGWYRYHHLFAALLRSELRHHDPAAEPTLHLRASTWHERHGDGEAATEHAIASGVDDRAGRLIWEHAVVLLTAGRGATVDRWLESYPREQRASRQVLALVNAWRCVTGHSPEAVDQWTAAAERLLGSELLPDGTDPAAVVATLRAMVGRRGLEAMRADATRAVELDTTDHPTLLVARLLVAVGLRLDGHAKAAREALDDVVRRTVLAPTIHAAALGQLATIDIAAERWGAARTTVERARAVVVRAALFEQPPQAGVHAVSALMRARDGERRQAKEDWDRARQLAGRLDALLPWMAIETRVVLARTAALLGDLTAARVLADEAAAMLETRPGWMALAPSVARIRAGMGWHTDPGGPDSLTTAELRVLHHLPTHLSLAAIGAELFVSRNTVKTQAIAIYRKLGVSNRPDAVERARSLGLLPGDTGTIGDGG